LLNERHVKEIKIKLRTCKVFSI